MEYIKLWVNLSMLWVLLIAGLWAVGNLGPAPEQPAIKQIVNHGQLADWDGPHISLAKRPPYYPN